MPWRKSRTDDRLAEARADPDRSDARRVVLDLDEHKVAYGVL
jgi:hypothetical protein